jgi:hypothetical protein
MNMRDGKSADVVVQPGVRRSVGAVGRCRVGLGVGRGLGGASRGVLAAFMLSGGIAVGVGTLLSMPVVSVARPPEPEPTPRRWELQFESGPIGLISVNVPDVGPRTYAYLTYTVTNNSGEDVFFAPGFDLADGEGTVSRGGRDVPAVASQAVLGQLKDALVQDQVQIIGELLQGPRHAKRGLVIWPVVNMAPESVTVYVSGLSGESRTITGPDGKSKFVLRKTLRLDFDAPGSLEERPGRILQGKGRQWIMR